LEAVVISEYRTDNISIDYKWTFASSHLLFCLTVMYNHHNLE